MGEFSMPERHANGLAALSAWDEEKRKQLYRALAELPVTLCPWPSVQATIDEVDTSIDAQGLAAAIRGLNSARLNHIDVAESALVSASVRAVLKHHADANKEELVSVVVNLLALSNVRLATKAGRLAVDSAAHVHDASIFTDLRPIFNEDGSTIDAAIINCTLKLDYATQEGSREFYVTVDEDDLTQIESAIARARRKISALRLQASQQGLTIISGDFTDE